MTSVSPFRTLLKGSAIAFSGNGLIYALAFVFQIMLVRLLGTGGYGTWGFAFTLMLTVAQLSTLGLGFASIYFASRGSSAVPSPASVSRIAIVSVLFFSGAAALFLPAAAYLWIVPAYHFENIGPLIYILSAGVPIVAFVSIAESIFRAHHDASAAFKMKLVPEALKVMVIPAALLLFGVDTRVVAASMLLVLAAPAVYGAYMLNKLVVPLRALWPARDFPAAAIPLLAYSLPFFLHEVLMMLRDRADTFIIGYISTASYLGIYRGAYVLAAMVAFIPNAVAYLLFPLMNRIVSEQGREELAEFGERTIKVLIYGGIPVVVTIIIFARQLMTRVLGPDFLAGERALLLLTLSSGAGLFHVFYGHVLASKNRVKLLLLANALAFVVNLTLNILLIPGYGITGAAAASLASSILLTLLAARFASAALQQFIFPVRTAGALLAALGFVAAAYIFRDRSIFISSALCVSFYAVWAAWLAVFERAEMTKALENLRSFVQKKRGG
ncbi:MAG: hypothetical protein COX65_09235 [Elusimicrobia bacterium CG_4_10_14_0_2_um_filter_56_8]|nr:MAG: hypothetical protein AUJ51_09220 [Elusimicrobia bacterium CG1_02_56_21]PJA12052.1 MAG: hypothetical protein COX65_09235 [Elusimicrobia bacterium CG_4_10_14_0_2_um_filter_56_8]